MTTNDSKQVQAASMLASTRIRRGHSLTLGTILILCVAYAVFAGIESRVEAKATLHQVAANSAIPSVNVVLPKGGAEAEEIELPGNTQAFTDTPIYARTSGYIKHWYVDMVRGLSRVSFLLSSRHRSSISSCNRPRLS